MSERRKLDDERARSGVYMGGSAGGRGGKMVMVSGRRVREKPEKSISRLEASKGRLNEGKPRESGGRGELKS